MRRPGGEPAGGLARRAWRSVFRIGWPRTGRERLAVMVSSFFLHLHPVTVERRSLRLSYSFGLGLASAFLFVVLVVTGLALMLYYVPHPDEAYRSMKDLRFAVSFGRVLRNAHRWAAHAMVVTVVLHMLRVFFTGAYAAPRQFNWVVGVGLLVLTLGLSFTGYLLPWDQLAYWAVTVGTGIVAYVPVVGDGLRYLLLGGNEIGGGALLRFYVLHCVILPAIAVLLLAVHLFRVRKDGLSAPADARPGPLPSWPHLLARELLLLLAVLVPLGVASLAFDAPLEEAASAVHTPDPARAPWYFLGLQELVHHSAFLGGVVVPVGGLLTLLLIPYLSRSSKGVGVWFAPERRTANLSFAAAAVAAVALTLIGAFFRGRSWAWVWPWTG